VTFEDPTRTSSRKRRAKAHRSVGYALFLAVAAVAATAQGSDAGGARSGRPNIVIMLADDLGWRDVGYHASEIRTPHLDALAREGVELDRFYVQPSCSPTRASLLTGQSPTRFGITRPLGKNEVEGLSLDARILPQYLAELGYQRLMIGKWHLGNHTPDQFPQARGFEYFYGYLNGGVGYWDHNHGGGHDWQRNGVTLREEGYSTRLLAEDAVRLIRERDRERPLFLYAAFGAPHLPNEAPPETVARYDTIADEKRRLHAAMVSELDSAVGRIVHALREEGLLDDTILLFSSDNGGLSPGSAPDPILKLADLLTGVFDRPLPIDALEFLVANAHDGASDNSPLRGGKMRWLEGGARVPASIGWPGRLEPGRHDGFMTIADVLPTLLEAVAGPGAIPQGLDGASQWATLGGEGTSARPDHLIVGLDGEAIYRSPWKLVLSDPARLYDVYADPLEEHDRAPEEPALVEELRSVAAAWPRGERNAASMLDILWDPDRFGGPEDREAWADAARRRAERSD